MARILICDDEAIVRDLVRAVLERDGHTVVAVSDGLEALEAHERQPHDLAIVDLIMPRKHGLDTVIELRALRPETRFVVMTGALPTLLDHNRNMDELLGEGVVKLIKPMKPADLLHAVRQALDPAAA
jgi:CheY-like chemotaxis protein